MNDLKRGERVQQIRSKLEERETEDLLDIWRKNNRSEWTAEAFETIREILIERNESVPDQEVNAVSDDTLEAEAEALERAVRYHNKENLIHIALRLKSLSWLYIVLFVLIVAADVIFLLQTGSLPGYPGQFIILFLVGLMAGLLFCAFFWLVLQAIAEGIYLLMDIENNTRRSIRSKGKKSAQ